MTKGTWGALPYKWLLFTVTLSSQPCCCLESGVSTISMVISKNELLSSGSEACTKNPTGTLGKSLFHECDINTTSDPKNRWKWNLTISICNRINMCNTYIFSKEVQSDPTIGVSLQDQSNTNNYLRICNSVLYFLAKHYKHRTQSSSSSLASCTTKSSSNAVFHCCWVLSTESSIFVQLMLSTMSAAPTVVVLVVRPSWAAALTWHDFLLMIAFML